MTHHAIDSRDRRYGWGRFTLTAVIVLAWSAGSASARVITVPDDYTTIQAAIDAAPLNGRIVVRPGTYVEELVIDRNVEIAGEGIGATFIQAPDEMTGFATQGLFPVSAVVRVVGGRVRISNLTVTGPFPCGTIGAGVRVYNGAFLELEDSHITVSQPKTGCPGSGIARGRGVVVGLPGSVQLPTGQAGSNGHARLRRLIVDGYQEVGLTVTAAPGVPPSSAAVDGNRVTGGGVS
jgi:hypothetical protein